MGRGRWLVGLALVAGVLVPPVPPAGAVDGCVDDVVPVALGPGRPQPCSAPDATPSRSRQWFDATSCFEPYVLPEAGHDINVHYTSQHWFAVAAEWTQRTAGAGGHCRGAG